MSAQGPPTERGESISQPRSVTHAAGTPTRRRWSLSATGRIHGAPGRRRERAGLSVRLRPTMGPLAALERFFERLFERQTARLFRTQLQPIQLQRRIERAMESNRHRDGQRTIVPDTYAVHLADEDLAALRAQHPSLAPDLADAALAFARSHGYTLGQRPTIGLVADPTVDTGDVRVVATATMPASTPAEGERSPAGGAPSGQDTAVFVVPEVDAPR